MTDTALHFNIDPQSPIDDRHPVEYQFAIEYLTQDGEPIGSVPFDPDWVPAQEWALWKRVRCGQPLPMGGGMELHIAPIWDEVEGAPVMSAARLETSDGGTAGEPIPTLSYFRSAALVRSAQMVEQGLLPAGAPYLYRVCAYVRAPGTNELGATRAAGAHSEGLAFDVEEATSPVSLDEDSLQAFIRASRVAAVDDGDEMPVFIPQRVMAEASARSRQADRVETGGILVGRLHRSRAEPEVFLEVTAMIPAPHTTAESQRLTFTHDTWSAVKNALELRRSNEIQLGWFHYHPRFCAKCPEEAQKRCAYARAFFSSEDVHMHRAIFPRAFQIALLLSDLGGSDLDASLFGWSQGVVTNRGFNILE